MGVKDCEIVMALQTPLLVILVADEGEGADVCFILGLSGMFRPARYYRAEFNLNQRVGSLKQGK